MKNSIKNILLTALATLFSMASLKAQISLVEFIGFEELKSVIPSGEVWNGSNGQRQYSAPDSLFQAELSMNIGWDTSWGGYWKNQWAFSRKNITTVEPSDFSKHLYAAKAGKGAEEQGEVYAIGTQNAFLLNPDPVNQFIDGFYITNTTFAYNSMAFGDNFGKKFTAADKDSFVLNIHLFLNGKLQKTQQVILADFRSTDTTKHMLLDTWQWVGLNATTDSIQFELQSSDVGDFGINTPLYFALDKIAVIHTGSVNKLKPLTLSVYPNPATDKIKIAEFAKVRSVEICDYRGMKLKAMYLDGGQLDISALSEGMYWVRALMNDGSMATSSFIKHN
jgi:hypothetical protein